MYLLYLKVIENLSNCCRSSKNIYRLDSEQFHVFKDYTQYPIIRNGHIRNRAEFWDLGFVPKKTESILLS